MKENFSFKIWKACIGSNCATTQGREEVINNKTSNSCSALTLDSFDCKSVVGSLDLLTILIGFFYFLSYVFIMRSEEHVCQFMEQHNMNFRAIELGKNCCVVPFLSAQRRRHED